MERAADKRGSLSRGSASATRPEAVMVLPVARCLLQNGSSIYRNHITLSMKLHRELPTDGPLPTLKLPRNGQLSFQNQIIFVVRPWKESLTDGLNMTPYQQVNG